ncbi:oxidoreductase [Streptomyces sp. NP160]|uniref:PDR/VanB family oxidoreductase n=1 Tax=Streptomyces sp. NP160 TaxID=2586637 RepID=UPI00111A83B3|nr:PDR/VanB family oxidoreductase [Streptomyces sp. NP160]TNM68214.1 oxidoreductase [Streptomyces sp. NP160]
MRSLPDQRVPLRLRVAAREELTPVVVLLTLVAPDGAALPGYEAGAHVTVTAPNGRRRSYSVAEAGGPAPARYQVGVLREPGGRGGSVSLHDDVRVGDVLDVLPPRNAFPLLPARRYVLIAGGIGITPVRAMAAELRARGDADVEVLHLTRTAELAPWREELLAQGAVVHHSAERGRLDLWPWLAEPDDDARVYCCGPASLLEEVRALTAHWRPSRVHTEDFAGVSADEVGASPFTAVWEPTGARVDVPAGVSLLTALRRAGLPVDGDCEAGTCGTCRLRLVAGQAHHRDVVLDDDERAVAVMPCVSRALSEELVLAPPPR